MTLYKVGVNPRGRAHIFGDARHRRREELHDNGKEQMKPGLVHLQGPDFELVSDLSDVAAGEKIFKFRHGGWNATHNLIATNAGEHDAIPSRRQARPEFRRRTATIPRSAQVAVVRRCEIWLW